MAATATSADIAGILAAIRKTEGSPAYNRKPGTPDGASGAYQFIGSTWRANGGGAYASEAYLATPQQQDAIASRKVSGILAADPGNILAVPQSWYLGHPASPSELDQIPRPDAGNKLTVRQYDDKWLANAKSSGGGNWLTDALGGAASAVGGAASDAIGAVTGIGGDAASAVASAVTGALGSLVAPFIDGLKRLTITGLAVTLGLGLLGMGAYRSVKAAS